jgi:hypothetical protein
MRPDGHPEVNGPYPVKTFTTMGRNAEFWAASKHGVERYL